MSEEGGGSLVGLSPYGWNMMLSLSQKCEDLFVGSGKPPSIHIITIGSQPLKRSNVFNCKGGGGGERASIILLTE